MKFKQKKWGIATIVALIILSLSVPLYAVDNTRYEGLKQVPDRLLETGKSVIGQPLSYPTDGSPKITAMIVTIAPGEKTRVHKHPVPLFVYILSGEIAVKYEGKSASVRLPNASEPASRKLRRVKGPRQFVSREAIAMPVLGWKVSLQFNGWEA